jgi:ankyrin repeat protein
MTDPRALDCVRVLVDRGADVNLRGSDGNVPLHGVAVMPDMDQRLFDGTLKFPPEIPGTILAIVRLLLERGAYPSISNNDGARRLVWRRTRHVRRWNRLRVADNQRLHRSAAEGFAP